MILAFPWIMVLRLRASFTFGSLLFLLFAVPAARADSAWTACPKGANLIGDFLDQHELAMRFNRGLPLNPRSSLTIVRHSGKWRKYWGTALFATFNHAEGAQLPAGTVLRFKSRGSDGGHMPVKNPHSLEELYSSSSVLLEVESRTNGVYMVTLNGQPFSDIHVRRLERLLPVTLLCAPIGTAGDP